MRNFVQRPALIRNSPMKSPSPDYLASNRNMQTRFRLDDSFKLSPAPSRPQQRKMTPSKFPIIPSPNTPIKQITEQSSIKQEPNTSNRVPSVSPRHRHISLTVNKNKQQNAQTLNTKAEQATLKDSVDEKIKEIYELAGGNQNQIPYESYSHQASLFMLQFIKNSIEELQKQTQQIKDYDLQQFHTFNKGLNMDSINSSSKPEEQAYSIFQIKQIQMENQNLRREVAAVKIELQMLKKGQANKESLWRDTPLSKSTLFQEESQVKSYLINDKKNSMHYSAKQGAEEKTSASLVIANQFLKEKNDYLEAELENRNTRITLIQSQREDEVSRLREKLNSANHVIKTEMETYNKVIDQQKRRMQKMHQQIEALTHKCQQHEAVCPNKNSQHQSKLWVFGDNSQHSAKSSDTPIRKIEQLMGNEKLSVINTRQNPSEMRSVMTNLQQMKSDRKKTKTMPPQFQETCEGCLKLREQLWIQQTQKLELLQKLEQLTKQIGQGGLLGQQQQMMTSKQSSSESAKKKRKGGKFQRRR